LPLCAGKINRNAGGLISRCHLAVSLVWGDKKGKRSPPPTLLCRCGRASAGFLTPKLVAVPALRGPEMSGRSIGLMTHCRVAMAGSCHRSKRPSLCASLRRLTLGPSSQSTMPLPREGWRLVGFNTPYA
jgi:hypothetical protein